MAVSENLLIHKDKAEKNKKFAMKLVIIPCAILLYSIGIKWFVRGTTILPSGLTGLSILIQNIFIKLYNIELPFAPLNIAINSIPAFFCYKIVGKRFTIISFFLLMVYSTLTDLLPPYAFTNEPLLAAIFGGIATGSAAALIYKCGVVLGGTDFIAMPISELYHVESFSYIMTFNMIMIAVQGALSSWDTAFYSIIFQFVATQVINTMYQHYQMRTIIIITEQPELISEMITKETGHSSTIFNGIGSYTKKPKSMLYTVVVQPQVKLVTRVVHKYDEHAFINVMRSNEIQGNFKYLSASKDDL